MDAFTSDIIQKIVKAVKSETFSITKVPWMPLPEPENCEASAVDGGGGIIYLGPASLLYIARAICVGKDKIKDSKAEVLGWESTSFLEAMRSYLELKIANDTTSEYLFIDGSLITMLTKWVERIRRVAFMRSKTSEIVALKYTIPALKFLTDLMNKATFVIKDPKTVFFKNFILMREAYEISGDERFLNLSLRFSPKEAMELLKLHNGRVRELLRMTLNPMLRDVHLIPNEDGVSYALEIPIPVSSNKLNAWIKYAVEVYEEILDESLERPIISFPRPSVRFWIVRNKGNVIAMEEGGTSTIKTILREYPKSLRCFLSDSYSGVYHSLLELAHRLSTLRSDQLEAYALMARAYSGGIESIKGKLLRS